MTRIYVTQPDADPQRAGFFTKESATYWRGDKKWDGHNLVDVNTSDQNRGQGIYRTAQGRWVLHSWSSWDGEEPTYRYVEDADARDWLLFNDAEDAVREHFGEPEDERGPGRPEIGAPVQVRLGDLLPQVDAWATQNGVKRAEAVRRLVATALSGFPERTL